MAAGIASKQSPALFGPLDLATTTSSPFFAQQGKERKKKKERENTEARYFC